MRILLAMRRAHNKTGYTRRMMQNSIFNRLSSILHLRSPILIISVIGLTACRQDMHDQPKYIPLRPVDQIGTITDGRSARPLVEGTVARGELRDDVEWYTGKTV